MRLAVALDLVPVFTSFVKSSITGDPLSGAACSAPALVTFSTAPSDPLSEEPVHDENVAIDDRKDTLEALSTPGPECSDAAYPAPALEDFDQSRKAASTTLMPACSAACSASALDTFDNEHLTLHTMSSTCFKDYLADSCEKKPVARYTCLLGWGYGPLVG